MSKTKIITVSIDEKSLSQYNLKAVEEKLDRSKLLRRWIWHGVYLDRPIHQKLLLMTFSDERSVDEIVNDLLRQALSLEGGE